MQFTETPETVTLEKMHYVFVEKVGPFQQTAQAAWKEARPQIQTMAAQVKILGVMALYRVHPEMVYRAGMAVDQKPTNLPDGLRYEEIDGGKYSKFTLTGSYMNLPAVSGRVFEIVKAKGIQTRAAFNIERYANDPSTVPEDQLVTEIMIPTK